MSNKSKGIDEVNQLLTTREVAKILNVSTNQVRQMIDEGRFPRAEKKGGHWLIPSQYLERKQSFWRRHIKQIGGISTALATIITLLLAAIALIPDSSVLNLSFIEVGLKRAFPVARSNQVLIIVAAFDYSENLIETKAHVEIERAIEQARSEAGLTEQNTRVEVYPIEISNELDEKEQRLKATKIGGRYNASMIIWGSDSGVRVTVHFLDLKQPDFELAYQKIEETDRSLLADRSAYAKFVVTDLPSHITFLSLYSIGYSYYSRGMYSKSIGIMEKAVKSILHDEQDIEGLDVAYFRLGFMYEWDGSSDEALLSYSMAIDKNPEYSISYIGRGRVYRTRGKQSLAINDYNKAIELDAFEPLAYNNRGNAYRDIGDEKRGIADYEKAIELYPEYELAHFNLGNAYLDTGNPSRAISEYVKAIEYDFVYPVIFNNRGDAFIDLGDPERAIADYDQAIVLEPRYTLAYSNRGNAYALKGDYQRAIVDYDKALELDPNFPFAYHGRGNAYSKLGELQRAIADYIRAIEVFPEFADSYRDRGGAFKAIGEYPKALADFQKYLELAPDAEDRQEVEGWIVELQEKINQP